MGRRERERDRRREEITAAAQRVFAAKGYAAATMEDIASEAELSKGTLYLYFENKEALFITLAGLVAEGVIASFEAIRATGLPTALDSIREMLSSWARIAEENPEKFRVLVTWIASNHEADVENGPFCRHRDRVERIIGLLVETLRGGIADGSIRDDLDPVLTAAELWGAMLGVNVMALNFDELHRRFPQPIDRSQFIPRFVALLCRGLQSSPP